VIEDDGLRFEVLESTARKVEKVRVSRTQPGLPFSEASA
jgi:CBS domain containing-hemolysin-like protein